jgi:hypothetical protein
MKHYLQPLWVSKLTNLEGGQLMKRHLNDLRTLNPALLTDVPFTTYVKDLTGDADLYEKALAQVQKNEETEKIALADNLRDKALEAFAKALKLYAVSDDPAEVEASRALRILYDTFTNLARLNYEAETIGIDKLVGELAGPNYGAKVGLLKMERYVTRISNANEAFKALFGGRMTTTAMTETYDLKSIRLEMFKRYSEFCDYVLAMANALNTPLFVTTLNLLNTARKYYADLLARRTAAPQTDTTKPAV